jgi:lysyl-tRNA synthetase class 2
MPHNAGRFDAFPTAGWENLRVRARLLRRVREFFDDRGFLEVETPILSADTVVDRHLDPFCVEIGPLGERPARAMWLQTSPEFAMKRLLAAGGRAIYQVARAFRRDELGPLHNCEFTMVEWYRAGDAMPEGIRLLDDLQEALLGRGPAERATYGDVFREHVGLDPHAAGGEELMAAAKRHGLSWPDSLLPTDRDGWLDLLVSERVQPHLGRVRPTIVRDYPAGQAALARLSEGSPPVAERFELYVAGIELANGYHELIDPAVLRRRNAENNQKRAADGKSPLPQESRLLAAMDLGLPPCTGAALGFDRVVMLAAGASCLAEVMAFPFDRA